MTVTAEAPGWRTRAACRSQDPDLFFPVADPGTAAYAAQAAEAQAVCSGCPVRRPCLEYALATFQRHGIWGGTDEGDRHLEARRRQRRRREYAA